MSDTTFNKFFTYGTNADRLAFTPSPPMGVNLLYQWYETDTGNTYIYDSAWHLISTGGATPLLKATVTLTNAQIKALQATPITFGTAPGAGFYLQPQFGRILVDTVDGAYTAIDADAWINIHTADWAQDTLSYLLNGNSGGGTQLTSMFGGAATRKVWPCLPIGNIFELNSTWGFKSFIVTPTDAENQGFEIAMDNGGTNLTGGGAGNILIADVYYTIEAI